MRTQENSYNPKYISKRDSLESFSQSRFNPDKSVNIFYHKRPLTIDFNPLAAAMKKYYLENGEFKGVVETSTLKHLKNDLDKSVQPLLEIIENDFALAESAKCAPFLRLVEVYMERTTKYHADPFNVETDRYRGSEHLATNIIRRGRISCRYTDPITEFINPNHVIYKEESYKEGEFYSLELTNDAKTFNFEIGDLVKQCAAAYINTIHVMQGELRPSIHRAKPQQPGDLKLIMLASPRVGAW